MVTSSPSHTWSVTDSLKLYNLPGWSEGYFSINEQGCLVVHPEGPGTRTIDLRALAQDLFWAG